MAVLFVAITSLPAKAVQRAFVASFGNDANAASNCGFTNPCRGFAAALTVTDAGGEIIALDAAGYGAVTITRSVAIVANPGSYAGISVSSGNAVTIATAGVDVTLRGLTLNGVGAAGSTGVLMSNGSRLSVENCVISNFNGSGIEVSGTSARVRVQDSLLRGNTAGVYALDGPTVAISGSRFLGHTGSGLFVGTIGAATTTVATVIDSVFSGNFAGVEVGTQHVGAVARLSVASSSIVNNTYGVLVDGEIGTQVATVGTSMVTGNQYGLFNVGGTLESMGNNIVRQNSSANTTGTITVVSGT